jgi:hypothetical protein
MAAPGQPSGPVVMRDLGIGKLKDDVADLARQRVTVGYQGPSGQSVHPNAGGDTVAQVAAWMEFGTPGSDDRQYDATRAEVPSRPFVRTMFHRYRSEIAEMIKSGLRDLLAGKSSLADIQARIGEFLVAKTRETIDDAQSWARPLAESTVEKKGHAKPLFETGTMRDAASYAVRDGDKIVRQGGET